MRGEIDTVVFDLGGVLIDWSPYHLYRKLFDNDDQIARFLDEIDLYSWLRGVDADKPFQRGVAELSARLPQHAPLIEAYWHHWAETLLIALLISSSPWSPVPLRLGPLARQMPQPPHNVVRSADISRDFG